MRKRLYFVVPNINEAKAIVDELLLSRIDDHHIHVMAKEGVDIEDLPAATIFEKSDIIHGIETGMIVGGLLGLIGSVVAIVALQLGSMMGLIVLGCTLFGAGFGIWTSGMIGSSTPNTRLKDFEQSLSEGKLLIMADVPVPQIQAITDKVKSHKKTELGGTEPSMPAFP